MFSFLRNKKPRTIFIGDVHGCIDELQAMCKRLRLSQEDRIVMLGDLINRGPDPGAVVAFVAEKKFDCLMGNHEDEYLKEYKHEEKYAALREELGLDLHRWIEERPLWIDHPSFLCVHAGLKPGALPASNDRRYLLNIRTWDGEGRDIKTPSNPAWYEYYTQPRPVFYGHWAQQGLTIRRNTVGLDSGCVYGRALSAWILEEERLVQQKSKRVYYVPPALRKKVVTDNTESRSRASR